MSPLSASVQPRAQFDQIVRVSVVAFDVAQIAFDQKRSSGIYECLIAELIDYIESEPVSIIVGPGVNGGEKMRQMAA